jgi:quercetin dioxygenase-like cupin family protein
VSQVEAARVAVVNVADVPNIDLPGGSWSRMLITRERVPDNASSLGFSTFRAGTSTALVSHQTEETAYVVSGRGELRLEQGTVPFTAGDALCVPAGLWHAVVNTGDQDMTMVFGFPHPEYPPTERR